MLHHAQQSFPFAIFLSLGVFLSSSAAEEYRSWTDKTGKFRTEAKFVELKDGHVHLKKKDGSQVAVDIATLSLADQEFAKAQADLARNKATAKNESPNDPNLEETTESGQRFLKKMLAELDLLRSTKSFREWGFSLKGPHNKWLKTVEAKREEKEFSLRERIAVGDLEMLGLNYLSSKGKETELTRYSRSQIEEALGLKSKAEPPPSPGTSEPSIKPAVESGRGTLVLNNWSGDKWGVGSRGNAKRMINAPTSPAYIEKYLAVTSKTAGILDGLAKMLRDKELRKVLPGAIVSIKKIETSKKPEFAECQIEYMGDRFTVYLALEQNEKGEWLFNRGNDCNINP